MPRPRFAANETYVFTIKRNLGSRPTVPYLATRLSIPESWIESLIAAGCVWIDERPASDVPEIDVAPGVTVRFVFPPGWPPHLAPAPMDLAILYEDEYLIALDKPPGIVVHPARGYMQGGTLQNGVLHRFRDRIGREGVTIGPAHRLDKDTSGVIVYGLATDAYRALVEQFATQHPHKEYLAIVRGEPAWEQTTCAKAIGVHPDDSSRCAVVPEHAGGKPAQTHLYCLERGAGWALIRANPLTGRPHQVRVHLAALGHPVLGDKDYAPGWREDGMARQALHASALTLPHPITRERLRLDAPLPTDMAELLAKLRV